MLTNLFLRENQKQNLWLEHGLVICTPSEASRRDSRSGVTLSSPDRKAEAFINALTPDYAVS